MSVEERVGAEFGVPRAERARAVRVVAAVASNADECREVLTMLGLDPREARAVPDRIDPDTSGR
ncbi:hypothetical protein [Umezawaea sp.]|uniref:hypothetical protein n=1 Tax=Umezawaea sp. TaxID=1955258 RepID=UPI002ED3B8AB